MKPVPRWIWVAFCGWHRLRRGHWPDFILLHQQFECLACDRDPPSRGMFVPVMRGV